MRNSHALGSKSCAKNEEQKGRKDSAIRKKSLVDAYGYNCIATGSLWRRCRRAPRTREAAYRAAFNGLIRVEVKSRHRTPLRMHNRRWRSFSLHLKHLLVSHDRSKAFLLTGRSEKLNKFTRNPENVVNVEKKRQQLGEARLDRYQRSTLGLCISAAKRSRAF